MSTRLSSRAERRGNERLAQRFGAQRADAERRAEVIRSVLIGTRSAEATANGGEAQERDVDEFRASLRASTMRGRN